MSVNLEGLSSKELAELITRANQRKKVLAKRKPANQVKAAVAKFLTSVGWTFDELYGKSGGTKPAPPTAAAAKPARKSTKGRKLGKVAPKYRNPANPKETWAGRGKQPKWLALETAKGRKLDEFLIK
jgi:DNA-binding protein H-NS